MIAKRLKGKKKCHQRALSLNDTQIDQIIVIPWELLNIPALKWFENNFLASLRNDVETQNKRDTPYPLSVKCIIWAP